MEMHFSPAACSPHAPNMAGVRHSFLLSNIPFRCDNDPDDNIPTYRKDYEAFHSRRAEPAPKAAPAHVMHRATRPTPERSETHLSFTHLSFTPHPLQPRLLVPRWTKLQTSFKMPTSSTEDGFVTTASEYRLHRPEQLHRPQRAKTGTFVLRGPREEPPRSVHRDSYSAPDRVDRRAALGPDPNIPTLKGDGHPGTFQTHYKTTFDRKPLSETTPVRKSLHCSTVSLGDKDKISERQSTHSASFTRPPLPSSPVLKERPQLHLSYTPSQSWSSTSRDTYRRHPTDPVVHVTKNKNFSALPKGDMDPARNKERMSSTTSTTDFTQVKAVARLVPEAGLRTKSNVHFSPAELQSSYYSTSSSEHQTRDLPSPPRPASYRPSHILRGPDEGPSLTTTQVDFVSLPSCKAEPPSASHQTTNIQFPVAAELYSTTHKETYTPKDTCAPRPAQNQLSSHILLC